MNPEIALLIDTWDCVKSFIPAKERLHVAENIVRAFEDNLDISDAEANVNEFDSVMKAAIVSHFDIGFDEEEDVDDWD
jgi:hypothetical protein